MNKRGSIFDSISVPLYILIIGCTIFLAYYIWTSFVVAFTPIATNVQLPDGRNLTAVQDEITVSISQLDYMFPFLVLGLLIVSLIFAYKTGASVVYAYMSIVMWVLAVVLSVIFEHIFEVFATNFSSIGGTLVIISYLLENIKWISLIWAFAISFVMFTRKSSEEKPFAASEMVFG